MQMIMPLHHVFLAVALVMSMACADLTVKQLESTGHPMYRSTLPWSDEERKLRAEEKHRMLQNGCQYSTLYVNYSQYTVDFMGGTHQYGVSPLYLNENYTSSAGKWWWEWATAGNLSTGTYREYGTMMIEYNPEESIVFDYTNTQIYWPITGGYLKTNSCPAGYARNEQQVGDIKSFGLYMCPGGCTGK